jgi:hypothetical protein
VPEFRILEDVQSERPASAALTVTPFLPAEIVSGAAIVLAIGLQLDAPEMEAFKEAFQWVWKPVLPTAKVIEQLAVGEALATYGVGHGMGIGRGLDQLPPFARIACGALVLGVAGYMAHRAVLPPRRYEEDVNAQSQSAPVGMADAGPEPGWDRAEPTSSEE